MSVRNFVDGTITGDSAETDYKEIEALFTGAYDVDGFAIFSRVGNMATMTIGPINCTSNTSAGYLQGLILIPEGFRPKSRSFGIGSINMGINSSPIFTGILSIAVNASNNITTIRYSGFNGAIGNIINIPSTSITYICE